MELKAYQAHVKGLRALAESHTLKILILVSFEEVPKKLAGNIECLYWYDFSEQLWSGQVIRCIRILRGIVP